MLCAAEAVDDQDILAADQQLLRESSLDSIEEWPAVAVIAFALSAGRLVGELAVLFPEAKRLQELVCIERIFREMLADLDVAPDREVFHEAAEPEDESRPATPAFRHAPFAEPRCPRVRPRRWGRNQDVHARLPD